MDVYIEDYGELLKARFYVLRSADELEREFQQFLTSDEPKDKRDLSEIKAWMQKIGNERGAEIDLFRDERAADALPPPSAAGNRLRLYCLRCSDDVVVLGGGGRKPKSQRKAETGHEMAYPFEVMNEVVRILRNRIKTGHVRIENKALHGGFRTLTLRDF